jgi:hypothetical protein
MGGLIACSYGWYLEDLSWGHYSFNQYLNITLLDENVEESVMTIMHSRTLPNASMSNFVILQMNSLKSCFLSEFH